MSKVYVVYEDWSMKRESPEIIGAYEDEREAYAHSEMQHETRCKNGFRPESDFEICVDVVELTRIAIKAGERRKVLITDGMSHDAMLFITDARKSQIEDWCYTYNKKGAEVEPFDSPKAPYYVKKLLDSEIDEEEDFEVVGFDEDYNLADYVEERMARKLYEMSLDMDCADYLEHKDVEIATIEKELAILKENKCDSLLQALEIIVGRK